MHSVERKCNRNSVWFCVDDVIKVGGIGDWREWEESKNGVRLYKKVEKKT